MTPFLSGATGSGLSGDWPPGTTFQLSQIPLAGVLFGATQNYQITFAAVDDTYIYFVNTSDSEVWRALTSDGSGAQAVTSSGGTVLSFVPIAVDDTHVFYSVFNGGTGANDLYKASKTDGSGPVLVFSGAEPYVGASQYALVTTGDYLFWSENSGGSQGVYRSLKDGSATELVASGSFGPVAVFGDELWWAGLFDYSIWTAHLDGSASVQVLASPDARMLAVDANWIYWVNSNNEIWRALKDGTGASLRGSGAVEPSLLMVDDSYLYWQDVFLGTSRVTTGQVMIATVPLA